MDTTLWTITNWILCYHKWNLKIKRIWSFCALLFSFNVNCSERKYFLPHSRNNQQTQITYLVIDNSWNPFYRIILQTRTVSFYRNKLRFNCRYSYMLNNDTFWRNYFGVFFYLPALFTWHSDVLLFNKKEGIAVEKQKSLVVI